MDTFETAVLNLRVDLRCPNAGMAEQFLQSTNLRPPGQHVSGKTVTQRMRADLIAASDPGSILLHQFPNRNT